MQFSAIVNNFIVKTQLNSAFTNDLKENKFSGNCSQLQTLNVKLLSLNDPLHEISNNVVCATSRASDQPAHTRSLIRAFASRLNIR